MSRQSNVTDFHGNQFGRTDAMYDNYQDSPVFSRRAEWINQRYPAIGKVCIVGCGPYAYLVKQLVSIGVNAFGFDSCNKTPFGQTIVLDPLIATGRVILDADVTNNSDVQRIKGNSYARITGQQKFGLIVTEDVLGCLTTSEQGFVVGYLGTQGTNILHIITCIHPEFLGDPPISDRVNLNGEQDGGWKTQAEWRTLLNANGGSAHVCLDTETWEVF
jgi:hypothetical protein